MVTSGSGLAYEHPHLWFRRPTFHCSTGWYDFFSSQESNALSGLRKLMPTVGIYNVANIDL